ncbi:hypothetical protein N7520_003287 [Penicillium odoratum]|uniref:uncharacterized protein n=1 Tax=Penicillium odoratum TaxID=1167516 RepID=UPI002547AB96|nr:uncharacterized protein N7520_003287 [Penicillium odoratum]KAJ5768728.1 hypothetical protein N7520_003287 [Penicillium odoratum]
MAKIEACNNSDLAIHLDSINSFIPGQTITGYVSQISRWVDTETSISIILHGRCNTALFCNDSSYCSSLELFGKGGVQKELFNGALHIRTLCSEEGKWFFTIDIPSHLDPSSLKSLPFGKASYLSLLRTDQLVLPPSFTLGASATVSRRGSAVVEYYLEATMVTPSPAKSAIARLPVQIQCESSPFPITDFDIVLHSRQCYNVTSPYLVSGMENTKIPMRQKIACVLGFPTAPRLTFRLEICIASVVQKGSPYHIPIKLRAIPQWIDTSQCVANAPQIIDITEFTLAVRSTSSFIAYTTDAVAAVTIVHEDHSINRIVLADHKKFKTTNQINYQVLPSESCLIRDHPSYHSPLALPIGDNVTPLDIGQILDLKLRHEQFPLDEIPTFITHNIKRTYEFEWKMSLEVGGKMVRVNGRHPVLIMEKSAQN